MTYARTPETTPPQAGFSHVRRRFDVDVVDAGWCPEHGRRECLAQRKGNPRPGSNEPGKGPGRCHAPAVSGTDPPRCRMHIGSRAGHATAAIRAAVARWTDDQSTLDPGETLLRLMTVAYLRAEQHADELDNILTEHGWTAAFVGDTYIAVEDGTTRKVGEYAKQLAVWEAQERKHAADLAVRAVAAGLEERRVRVIEEQVDLFARALDAALAELGMADRSAEVKSGVARNLRAVAS
jgi:hypothetical protein